MRYASYAIECWTLTLVQDGLADNGHVAKKAKGKKKAPSARQVWREPLSIVRSETNAQHSRQDQARKASRRRRMIWRKKKCAMDLTRTVVDQMGTLGR